ncbi:hypothetical protein D3C71_1962770 [compost metagenome]
MIDAGHGGFLFHQRDAVNECCTSGFRHAQKTTLLPDYRFAVKPAERRAGRRRLRQNRKVITLRRQLNRAGIQPAPEHLWLVGGRHPVGFAPGADQSGNPTQY